MSWREEVCETGENGESFEETRTRLECLTYCPLSPRDGCLGRRFKLCDFHWPVELDGAWLVREERQRQPTPASHQSIYALHLYCLVRLQFMPRMRPGAESIIIL